MHYKDGSPARAGDLVMFREEFKGTSGPVEFKRVVTSVGFLTSPTPGSGSCDAQLRNVMVHTDTIGYGSYTVLEQVKYVSVNQCECLARTAPLVPEYTVAPKE